MLATSMASSGKEDCLGSGTRLKRGHLYMTRRLQLHIVAARPCQPSTMSSRRKKTCTAESAATDCAGASYGTHCKDGYCSECFDDSHCTDPARPTCVPGVSDGAARCSCDYTTVCATGTCGAPSCYVGSGFEVDYCSDDHDAGWRCGSCADSASATGVECTQDYHCGDNGECAGNPFDYDDYKNNVCRTNPRISVKKIQV